MQRILALSGDDGIARAITGLQTASLPQRQRKIQYLLENFEDACHTDEFARLMDEASLEQLLTNDEVHASERTIFEGVLTWARIQLELKGTPITPENMRTQLHRIIPHIRFPTMEFEDLSGMVKETDILTTDELVDCFVYKGAKGAIGQTNDTMPTSRFTTRPRVGLYLSYERKRAAYKRRQQRSLTWQKRFHFSQAPLFICGVPSLLFFFLIFIGAYYDNTSGITWWFAYLPMWLIVVFIIINLTALIYFYRRAQRDPQPDNRTLCCFVGVYDHERGPFKQLVETVERNPFGQRWMACLISSMLLFLILIGCYQSPSTSLSPWIVYAPFFIFMCVILALPLVGNGNIRNKLQPCAAACCLVWLPISIMFIMSLIRQYHPTSLPLWACLIPIWILYCCGGCGACIGLIVAILNRRLSSNELPAVGVCCATIPLLLTAIFLSVRASQMDRNDRDAWHLLTSLSPLIIIIGLVAIASCYGAVIVTRSLPMIHPTALPMDLRDHTEPPADAVLPPRPPATPIVGITIAL